MKSKGIRFPFRLAITDNFILALADKKKEEEGFPKISTGDKKIYTPHHPALFTNSYSHPDTDLSYGNDFVNRHFYVLLSLF